MFAKPRKDCTSLTVEGMGQLAIPATLTRSMARDPGLTIIPRYSISETLKEHVSSFR